jgi:hypothetical protein
MGLFLAPLLLLLLSSGLLILQLRLWLWGKSVVLLLMRDPRNSVTCTTFRLPAQGPFVARSTAAVVAVVAAMTTGRGRGSGGFMSESDVVLLSLELREMGDILAVRTPTLLPHRS